jgi:hypothetical protein
MTKELTIKQVKKNKMELELSFLVSLKKFEDDNSLKVRYININRVYPKDKKGYECAPCNPQDGVLKDISIDVDLDLVY